MSNHNNVVISTSVLSKWKWCQTQPEVGNPRWRPTISDVHFCYGMYYGMYIFPSTGWPKKPQILSIPSMFNFFTGIFRGKFVLKWLLNIPTHLNCVRVKYKFSKVVIITMKTYSKTYIITQLLLWSQIMFSFTYISGVCKLKTILSYTMVQKIKLQTRSYLFQILMDFILQIYISQGSIATQLRCGGIFSNHIANVPQNVPVKNWKSVNIWQWYGQKFSAYFLSHPVFQILQIWRVLFCLFQSFSQRVSVSFQM